MKIFVDIDVVLEVVEKKSPHYATSSSLLSKVLTREITGVLPGHALVTIFYAVLQTSDARQAQDMVDWFLANFEVAPLEKEVFINARNSEVADFEDSLVTSSAVLMECDYIVTRHVESFEESPLPALTPEEVLYKLSKETP